MDAFNLETTRELLKSNELLTCGRAVRLAIANIPHSEPLLPDLYRVYCKSSFAPNASDAFAAICRHRSVAVPFLTDLLDSADSVDRQNAIHLLLRLGHNPSSYRIFVQTLDDRPDSQPDWGTQRDLVIQKLNDALSDPHLDVRTIAAVTLDDINETPNSIVTLLVDGLESNDIYIQNISALHLGRLGAIASPALHALNDFVESNTDPTNGNRRPVLAARNAIKRINGT